jgi:hypothetical protein
MNSSLLRILFVASAGLCLYAQPLSIPMNVGTYPTLAGEGVRSYFKVTLTDLMLTSSTLQNGTYKGWCADKFSWAQSGALHFIYPTSAQFPGTFASHEALRMVTYIINNRNGAYMVDVQNAIWHLLEGVPAEQNLSPGAQLLVQNSRMFGRNFVPGSDDAQLFVLYKDGYSDHPDVQDVLVELHCPRTQGYWQRILAGLADQKKDHPDANRWDIRGLWFGAIAANGMVIPNYYAPSLTNAQLLQYLETPVKNDARMVLLHQYIAAFLNVWRGAVLRPEIAQALVQSEQLLLQWFFAPGMTNSKIDASSPVGQAMVNLANLLTAYNEGRLTSGCAR